MPLTGTEPNILKTNDVPTVPSEDMLAETEVMVQTGVLISIDEELAGVLAIFDLLKLGARDVRSIHRPMKVKSITVIEMAKN